MVLVVRILPLTRFFFVIFICSVFLANELAVLKWNQAWHSSEEICALREREKDNFKSREVKRLKECALALTWHDRIHGIVQCFCLRHRLLIYSKTEQNLIRRVKLKHQVYALINWKLVHGNSPVRVDILLNKHSESIESIAKAIHVPYQSQQIF